jgi:transposase
LLEQGRLPESWAPPVHLLDLRELVRLRKTLSDQRVQWQQRIHAVPFHHGVPKPAHALTSAATRDWLHTVPLPAASRLLVLTGLAEIDWAEAHAAPSTGGWPSTRAVSPAAGR